MDLNIYKFSICDSGNPHGSTQLYIKMFNNDNKSKGAITRDQILLKVDRT